MNIIELRQRIPENPKLNTSYIQFEKLLQELRKKQLPPPIITLVNQDVESINSISDTGDELKKALKHAQTKIIKLIEKELKIVPMNYYRNIWLVLGMSAFGLPIGAAIGLSIGNIGLLAVGLPIGMLIGMVIGSTMDKKALQEGRQLAIEIKY